MASQLSLGILYVGLPDSGRVGEPLYPWNIDVSAGEPNSVSILIQQMHDPLSHLDSSGCCKSQHRVSHVHCYCLQLSFGWNTVKIDMSAARRDPPPIVPFGLAAFAATLFALGLALGTTIAVGMLFFIQVKFLPTSV